MYAALFLDGESPRLFQAFENRSKYINFDGSSR